MRGTSLIPPFSNGIEKSKKGTILQKKIKMKIKKSTSILLEIKFFPQATNTPIHEQLLKPYL